MKKIITKLLLSAGLVLALASCDSSADKSNDVKVSDVSGNSDNDVTLSFIKKSFEFQEGISKEYIEKEIKRNMATNGTVSFSDFTLTPGEKIVAVTSTYNGKSKTESVIVKITQAQMIFSLTKTNFEFDYGTSKQEIETEIKKYISTNGVISFSAFDTTTSGTKIAYVTSTLFSQSRSELVNITIKEQSQTSELSFSISKSDFEFNYGVTKQEIETEIKNYVTTNGEIFFSTYDTTVGTKMLFVGASLGSQSQSESITLVIKEQNQSNNLTFSLSKTEFEFNYGVTKQEIETEVKKYVTTNGEIFFSTYDTTSGSKMVFVGASLGNQSTSESVTILIKEQSQSNDLTLSVSQTTFTFTSKDSVEYIQNEILKYVSSNGQLSISGVSNIVGSYDVYIFAALDGKSTYESITLIIVEAAEIEMSKTSFEFDYGTTEEEFKEEISKYITTNGTITYIGLSNVTSVGSYSCRVFVTKNNTSAYKDITVSIADKGVVKLTKSDFEFKYGTTYKEIKEEISKFIVTNCEISFPEESDSRVFYCSTWYVNINATYKGETTTHKIYFDIVPDESKIKSTRLYDVSATSSKMTYSLEIANNSGKTITSIKVLVYMYVNGTVRSFGIYELTGKSIGNGTTYTIGCNMPYNSSFSTFSIEDIATIHYSGYDASFCSNYSDTYKYVVYIQDVVYE